MMTVQALADKPLAFLRRDLLSDSSYRLSLAAEIAGVALATAVYFLLARLINPRLGTALGPYRGDYFAFVVLGVTIFDFFRIALRDFSRQIREALSVGTLESILATPTSSSTIVISSLLYWLLRSAAVVAWYVLIAATAFRLDVSAANVVASGIVLLLTALAVSVFASLSASLLLIFKRADPVVWLLVSMSLVLSGVYYPSELLPAPLRFAADLLPTTHAIRAFRLALLEGAPIAAVASDTLFLAGFALALLPASLWTFQRSVEFAKRVGTVGHY